VIRVLRTIAPVALGAVLACVAFAQPGPNTRQPVRPQGAGQAIQVWGMAGDGPGTMMPMGGPGQAQGIPEQMIVVSLREGVDTIYMVRGYTLYRYDAGNALQLAAQVDLRTDEEIRRAAQAGDGGLIWPDPAMLPVLAEYAPESGTLLVLRGGILRQYNAALEQMVEFDLRSEREKQGGPRIQVRMQPGPLPPPPPPDEAREQ